MTAPDPLDAGVISSDGPIVLSPDDADRVADLLAAPPAPTEAMRALFAARQPCAGWFEQSPGRWMLDAGPLTADASGDPGSVKWSIEVGERSWAHGSATTLEAAQLAAEDALLAVADEIRRAVGR